MVGDHVSIDAVVVRQGTRNGRRNGFDDRPEDVDVEDGWGSLQDRRCTLKPHPRVDAGSLQRRERAVLPGVELNEDEVPDLRVPIALAGDAPAIRSARVVGAGVVEDLGIRSARTTVSDRPPPVVLLPEAGDPILREADNVPPEGERLVIVVIDRDGEPVLGKPELVNEELPRQTDGFFLEVVPEREVAEHLEERVVERRPPDILYVRRAEALLARCGSRDRRRDPPPEDVFELDHPGGSKEERGVVWNQGRTRHEFMPSFAEEAEIGLAKVGGIHRDLLVGSLAGF